MRLLKEQNTTAPDIFSYNNMMEASSCRTDSVLPIASFFACYSVARYVVVLLPLVTACHAALVTACLHGLLWLAGAGVRQHGSTRPSTQMVHRGELLPLVFIFLCYIVTRTDSIAVTPLLIV